MKLIFNLLTSVVVMSILSYLFTGCAKRQDIIKFTDEPTFKITGYGKPSPGFVGGVNFYCFLNIDSNSFNTGQIDNVLIFKKKDDVIGFIYKDIDSENIYVTSETEKKKHIIDSANEIYSLGIEKVELHDFKFSVLGEKIALLNIESVLFSWDSGGIRFYAFNSLKDSVYALFDYKYFDSADKEKSGYVKFVKWKKGMKEWPVVESVERGIKDKRGDGV